MNDNEIQEEFFFTIRLTKTEVEAVDELSKLQGLSHQKVFINALRHYQLLVKGEPDLGSKLPDNTTEEK